jgi:hypothetical protein
MNKVFDYNGTYVSPSKPVKQLKTVKKTLVVDSSDRDTAKFYTNGDFVVYLPRTYENVVSLRLVAGEFPPLVSSNLLEITQIIGGVQSMTVDVNNSIGLQLFAGQDVVIRGATNPINNGTWKISNLGSSNQFTVDNSNNALGSTVFISENPTSASVTIGLTNASALTHSYSSGQNVLGSFSNWGNDLQVPANTYYFLIDLEGLNKTDECTIGADRSTYTDGFFAKIPALLSTEERFIEYNDTSAQENIATYKPAIGKLDRLHIRTRLHSQQGNKGFIYWTDDGMFAANRFGNEKGAEFSLTFEIEMLDNSFDEFSSFETFISDRK